METTQQRGEDNKVELSVTHAPEEVKKYIDAAYKKAGKVRIPGFRPGKAPRKVLENFYGGKEYFLAEATDELLKESLPLAIDAAGLIPLDRPEVGEVDPVKEDASYSYTVSLTVSPLLELSSYDPVQIEMPSEEPTAEEIDEQVDVMLNYYVDIKEVTGRGVKDGDITTMDIELTAAGERVEAMSGEKIPYAIGGGTMPKSFDKKLIGAKPNKELSFDLDVSGDEDVPAFLDKEKPLHATLAITFIEERVKPELTDEFAKEKLEFDSAEDFKAQIAASLKFRKANELASLKDRLLIDELTSRLEGEAPELLIKQSEQDIYRDFFNSLQRSGQSFDSFMASAGITPDVFREDIKVQAKELAMQTLAMDAWVRHVGIVVSDEDVKSEFESSGADDVEALYEQWRENGRLSEIRAGIARMKASRQISEEAQVFELGKKPTKAAKVKPTKKDVSADAKSARPAKAGSTARTPKTPKTASAKSGTKATKDSAKATNAPAAKKTAKVEDDKKQA